MSSCARRIFTAILVVTALIFSQASVADAAAYNSSAALTWLGAQQKSDGGFEVYATPGLETPDSALAIAEQANAGAQWNSTTARNAVLAQANSGKNALDYLDNLLSTSTVTTGKSGEIAVLASALNLDPTKFDPDGNGAVDLISAVKSAEHANGSFGQSGALSDTLFSILALRSNNQPVNCTSNDYLFSAQQTNGGFNYSGTKSDTVLDFDTTGRALMTMAAAGVPITDPHVQATLSFLATNLRADGGFLDNFNDGFPQIESNASATALVDLGLRAYGLDTDSSAWRDAAAPSLAGQPYVSPENLIASRQVADGHFESEYDFPPTIATISTSQSLQALSHSFIPGITGVTPKACVPVTSVLGQQFVNHNNNRVRFAFSDGHVTQCVKGSECSTIFVLPKLNAPVVDAAVTSTGNGFWLFASDGGVFTSGDANFFGSIGGKHLQAPIVGGKALPDDSGYVLFARDGGVFNFGASRFYGSANPLHISNVVGGAITSDGAGYDLFGSDGGVFCFGDARFHGSMAGVHLNSPITSGDVGHNSDGYALFSGDGGVFNFGSIPFKGSMASMHLNAEVVSGELSDDDAGYSLAGTDGGVFSFGDSNFVASLAPSAGSVRSLIIG